MLSFTATYVIAVTQETTAPLGLNYVVNVKAMLQCVHCTVSGKSSKWIDRFNLLKRKLPFMFINLTDFVFIDPLCIRKQAICIARVLNQEENAVEVKLYQGK